MSKNRDLNAGDVFPASWTDAIQEFIGTGTANLDLTLQSATTVQVLAGSASDQVAIGIDGLWRYRSTSITATATGAAGQKDIFVTAAANSYAPPDTDNTDYAFGLQVLAAGSTPTGVAAYRKVGELDWDGNAITALRQMRGLENATSPLSPIAGAAGTPALIAVGATSQTAPVLAVRATKSGANVFGVSAAGVALFGADVNLYRSAADVLKTDDAFEAALGMNVPGGQSYKVGGTALAASHLSNGTTGSGGVVLASAPTLTGVPLAPTAAADTNTTQIATTAFVIGQGYAKLASPVLTGNPTAPTPASNDNDTSIATTAFVVTAIGNAISGGQGGIAFVGSDQTFTGTNTFQKANANPVTVRSGAAGSWAGVAVGRTADEASLLAVGSAGVPLTGVAAGDAVLYIHSGTATLHIGSGTGAAAIKILGANAQLQGVPTAPTAAADTNTTQLATTAFVVGQGYVKAANAALTGNPTAPTPTVGDNDTSIATTAFVTVAVANATNNGATTTAQNNFTAIQTFTMPLTTGPAIQVRSGSGTADAALAVGRTSNEGLLAIIGTAGDVVSGSQVGDVVLRVDDPGKTLRLGSGTGVAAITILGGNATLGGTPTAPTAPVDTNTLQIATTAFVLAQGATTNPAMDGVAAAGSSPKWARADHVHPSDTTRQPADTDLTSIAALTAAGLLVRTSGSSWTHRTLQGTTGQITVTNGDGVGGDPTISLPATLTQATTFSAAGTALTVTNTAQIGTLTLTNDLTVPHGGTGIGTFTAGIVYSPGGTSALGTRVLTGTNGQITVTNGDGAAGNPTISLPTSITQATTFSAAATALTVTNIASIGTLNLGNALTVQYGGTGATTFAAGFVYGNGTNALATRTITGTAGQIDVANGTGASGNPTISLPVNITQGTTFSAAGTGVAVSNNLTVGGTATITGNLTADGGLTLNAGDNIVLATATGTKIGTATNQLLSFWNAAPLAQPASPTQTALDIATNGSSGVPSALSASSTLNDVIAVVSRLHYIMQAEGLLGSGGVWAT